MTSNNLHIGVMSGTSLDGIDVVLVDFEDDKTSLLAHSTTAYDQQTKQTIDQLVNSQQCDLALMCQTDRLLAQLYAKAVLSLLDEQGIMADQVQAIGCHGQTIKHDPNHQLAYTLQIGDPNTLASLTQITTVADFRRKDIALGGQGAPLAPAFHQYAFSSTSKNRAIINIGGIANISVLAADQEKHPVIGFDTGPGNTLMDHFCLLHFQQAYDKDGAMAAKGNSNQALLNLIIDSEAFFKLKPAKSTGTDYFNLQWFDAFTKQLPEPISLIDQLATLNELTAKTIALEITQFDNNIDEIYCCGGGCYNKTLMDNIQRLTQTKTQTSNELGIHADWVEAIAFAWFAKNTMQHIPSNLPSVTGASNKSILGGIYIA